MKNQLKAAYKKACEIATNKDLITLKAGRLSIWVGEDDGVYDESLDIFVYEAETIADALAKEFSLYLSSTGRRFDLKAACNDLGEFCDVGSRHHY
jgi:hypothetical protein